MGADAYEPVFVYSETEALDNVLQYYDNCPRYIDEVGDNATANIETEIYLAAILDDIAANLSRKLTVNGAWRVTPDEAFEMYAACQFDVTLFDKYDEWCSLFSLDEIEQFEYAEGAHHLRCALLLFFPPRADRPAQTSMTITPRRTRTTSTIG